MMDIKKFKIKRPHTPEHEVLQEYKKRRLIEEFERLSLSTGPTSLYGSPEPTKVVSEGIRLIKPAKKKAEETLISDGPRAKYDPILYETIEFFRFQAYQITKWYDWRKVLYLQWYNWFRCISKLSDAYMDMDVNMDMNIDLGEYPDSFQQLIIEKSPEYSSPLEMQEDIDMTDIW